MLDLGRRRYAKRWDALAVEGWFRNIVCKQPLIFLPIRLDNAFLIGVINIIPWAPAELEFTTMLICADDGKLWEVVTLLRFSIEWARKRKLADWRLSSETEFEFGALAKRLGAVALSPRYSLRLA